MTAPSEPKRHDLGYIPIDLIDPNDWNTQQMSDDEFETLCEEIEDIGFISAINVVHMSTGRYRIIGGEHRWKAAKAVGLKELPCLVLRGPQWTDEDLQAFVSVRYNVLHGSLNPIKFKALYDRLLPKYGKDAMQRLMAFTDRQKWDRLVGETKRRIKRSLPKDMQSDVDDAFKEAKTTRDLAQIVKDLYARFGGTVADHSFMILTFGKRDHIYVAMDAPMKNAMDAVTHYCRVAKVDLNVAMAEITQRWADEARDNLENIRDREASF